VQNVAAKVRAKFYARAGRAFFLGRAVDKTSRFAPDAVGVRAYDFAAARTLARLTCRV